MCGDVRLIDNEIMFGYILNAVSRPNAILPHANAILPCANAIDASNRLTT